MTSRTLPASLAGLGLSLSLAAALVAAPGLAQAATFDELAAQAERLDTLEPFLGRFVGRCTDPYERRTCEQNVAAARKAAKARTFAVRVQDAAQLIRPRLDGGSRFVLLLTPFIDGGGLALTHGTPVRQDRAGHPILDLVPIAGTLPPGTMEMEFESPFRVGAVELEIVFRPEKAWKLSRRSEAGAYEGVAARFLAIRVIDGRTGATIAERVLAR